MANSRPLRWTAPHLIAAPLGCWYDDTSGPSTTPAASTVGATATATAVDITAATTRDSRRGGMGEGSAPGRAHPSPVAAISPIGPGAHATGALRNAQDA